MSDTQRFIVTFPKDFKPTVRQHPAYGQWANILTRCRNRNGPQWKDYGGRGITVCQRWVKGDGDLIGFECFMKDMGPRPSKRHSVDRIDNHGNYEPSNCRWATDKEQANNRRSNHSLTYGGETLSMMDMAAKHGISYFILRNRIRDGWPLHEAITTPKSATGGRIRSFLFAKGDMLPQTKLTEESVRKIRKEREENKTPLHELARKFGVCTPNISMIVNRKTWAHLK